MNARRKRLVAKDEDIFASKVGESVMVTLTVPPTEQMRSIVVKKKTFIPFVTFTLSNLR